MSARATPRPKHFGIGRVDHWVRREPASPAIDEKDRSAADGFAPVASQRPPPPRIDVSRIPPLSGLTEAQVLAIAEHEHLPEIAATALAQYLSKQEHGMEKIRDMIVDDVRQAQQRGDRAHVLTLLHVLHHFLKSHSEVCRYGLACRARVSERRSKEPSPGSELAPWERVSSE
jgi:hypothetical protein